MKERARVFAVAVLRWAILAGGVIPALYVALSWALDQTAISAGLGSYLAFVTAVVAGLKSFSAIVSAISTAWSTVSDDLPDEVVDLVEEAQGTDA